MSKIIEISDALEEKIIAFCDDELDYHINESGCAEEYKDEIEAQIDLLILLGQEEKANKYKDDFEAYMENLDKEGNYES